MIVVDLDWFIGKLRELKTPEERRTFIEEFGKYPLVKATRGAEAS